MIKLMVGNNWDLKLLDNLNALNKGYSDWKNPPTIVEVYGSVIDNPIGTARPIFRLANKSRQEVEEFVIKAKSYNIDINYTLNTPCIGSLDDLHIKFYSIVNFIKWLENIGIKRVTITHPLLMEIVAQNSKLEIELSTVYHMTSIRQLDILLAGKLPITKVCVNLMKNRDFRFLHALQIYAKSKNVDIELMANEMCNYECIYRASCYNLHTHNIHDPKDRFSNYPMGRCIQLRDSNLVEWLKARFILPQWLEFYETEFGINHFKITGRTGTTDYITWVVQQYMQKFYHGNTIQLWWQLENIGTPQEEHIKAKNYIPAEKIDIDFLKHVGYWGCERACNNTCTYCEDYLNKILKKGETNE